jgi:uncharacterized metal-binding protein
MTDRIGCSCSEAPKLVFACSGSADVGALADQAARRMTAEGCGRMSCLAAFGAGIESFLEAAGKASMIMAIDGCPTDCTMRMLEKAGLEGVRHFRVTDLGLQKGRSPATPENIDRVVEHGKSIIG